MRKVDERACEDALVERIFITKSSEDAITLKSKIDRSLTWFKDKEFKYEITTLDNGIHVVLAKRKNYDPVLTKPVIKDIFITELASALASYIIEDLSYIYIDREIEKINPKNSVDKVELRKEALGYYRSLVSDPTPDCLLGSSHPLTLIKISHNLYEFMLENEAPFSIEGYTTFRLQSLLIYRIKTAVELALDEVASRAEYIDFLQLLKSFVNTQAPKYKKINVYISGNTTHIEDENQETLDEEKYNTYFQDSYTEELDVAELIVFLLVSLSPRELDLYLHPSVEHDVCLNAIAKVFNPDVKVYENCHFNMDALLQH